MTRAGKWDSLATPPASGARDRGFESLGRHHFLFEGKRKEGGQ